MNLNIKNNSKKTKNRQALELSIPFFQPHLGFREIAAVKRVLRSGWLTTGPETFAFEREFQAFLGASGQDYPETAAVNSATAGLHLALEALGIGPGDKVAVPTLTFTATAEVVKFLGAEPVFIDSQEESGNMDPALLQGVAKSIKAVIPVHLAGRVCDMKGIRNAIGPRVHILEDAAHAFPSRCQSGMAGTLGDMGVFSFYTTKTITTGEGGMVVSRNPQLIDRVRIMRLHGIDRPIWKRYSSTASSRSWEYDVAAPGYKYNMSDLAAAIGRVQLAKADKLLRMRRELSQIYIQELDGIPHLSVPKDTAEHAWHLFILKFDSPTLRDKVAQSLHNAGIGCSVHFIPLHRMTYWKKNCKLKAGDFPVAEYLADRILSIPNWPGLQRQQQKRIINVIRKEMYG